MNNANLYQKTNSVQKRDAVEIMSEFSNLFRSSKLDAKLLDIGCGSGDVLVDIILPKLDGDYTEVVGIDVSSEMVKYANEKYHSEILKFLQIDIESDLFSSKISENKSENELKMESFEFITSFYCLHWIQNQT